MILDGFVIRARFGDGDWVTTYPKGGGIYRTSVKANAAGRTKYDWFSGCEWRVVPARLEFDDDG